MAGLEGKVALVIGGTRGIGAAISRRLTSDGASLTVVYRSRSYGAERIVRSLEESGRSVLLLEADVSELTSLLAAIDRALGHYGNIDVLVNVAGTAENGDLDSYADGAFDLVFAVNVRAPFPAAQRVAASTPDGGRNITIGSIVADRTPELEQRSMRQASPLLLA